MSIDFLRNRVKPLYWQNTIEIYFMVIEKTERGYSLLINASHVHIYVQFSLQILDS